MIYSNFGTSPLKRLTQIKYFHTKQVSLLTEGKNSSIKNTESKYRESTDRNGKLTYASGKDRIKIIKDLKIYDLDSKKIIKISSLVNEI